ncbi:hypothetical protein B0H14DRAFT_3424274 [Mycena olivaceomarginata]|nr:hypothetical protein B0H14DRAFT_3424274 [Mycena olivaceomarginata]
MRTVTPRAKTDEDGSGEEDEDGDDYDEDEQDDDDEEAEEDEDDGDPVVVPSKRKRGSNKNAADTAPASRKIKYTTSVYASEQLKKPRSSRGTPVSKIFPLYSNEPWDVLKFRIRSNIGTALNLPLVQLMHCNIMFTVPHQVKDPIRLNDRKQYKHLVGNALKIKASPGAKILVEPKMLATYLGYPPAPAAAAPPPIPAVVPNGPAMLIPPGIEAGPSLSIEDFCAQYDLDDDICAR